MSDIPKEVQEEMEKEQENGDLNNVEHDLDIENLEMLDPRLVETLQQMGHEHILAEFDGSKRSGVDDKLSLVKEWFTEENDYRSDTKITPQQVYAMTMLRNIDKMFPNLDLEDTQSWVNDVVDTIERYMISVDGFARRQEENVLRSVFGDNSELSPEERDSMFMQMLSNPNRDDEE